MPIKREFFFARWMRLDLYVLTEVVGPFLGGIIFFLFIFLMFQILRLAEFFIIHGVSVGVLGKIVSLFLLSFIPVCLPIAFLIGILVGFGRLSADSELVAMKASGFSLIRLSFTPFCFAIVVSVLSLLLNLNWVPWGERTLKHTIIKVAKTKVVSSIKEGAFTSGFFDMLIFADQVDSKTNRMKHVFIFDERNPKNPVAVIGKEGEVINVRGQSDFATSILMRLHDGNIHRNNLDTQVYEKINYSQYGLFLKVEEGDDSFLIKPKAISYSGIQDELASPKIELSRVRELTTELWRRYATALTPIVFVFLGIGLGTMRTRAVRASASLMVFVVIFVFWTLQTGAASLAWKGILPPPLAMALPNFLLLIPAVISFRKASW